MKTYFLLPFLLVILLFAVFQSPGDTAAQAVQVPIQTNTNSNADTNVQVQQTPVPPTQNPIPAPSSATATVTHWYENSSIIGPLIGLFGGLLMFYLNKWWERRQKALADEDSDEEANANLITKINQMTSEERGELRTLMLTVHDKEINWYKEQLTAKDEFTKQQLAAKDLQIYAATTSEKAARLRSHNFINENERLKGHILLLQIMFTKCGKDIPEFTFTPYTQLMLTQMEDDQLKQNVENLEQRLLESHRKKAQETSSSLEE